MDRSSGVTSQGLSRRRVRRRLVFWRQRTNPPVSHGDRGLVRGSRLARPRTTNRTKKRVDHEPLGRYLVSQLVPREPLRPRPAARAARHRAPALAAARAARSRRAVGSRVSGAVDGVASRVGRSAWQLVLRHAHCRVVTRGSGWNRQRQ
jgi:hypothetical protein